MSVFLYALTQVTKSDGLVPIGEHHNSFFSIPSRLFFEIQTDEVSAVVHLVGVNESGLKITEVVTINGGRVFTKNKYVYVEKILVKERIGSASIIVKTESGNLVATLESTAVELKKVEYYATEKIKIVNYGFSCMENENTRPLQCELVTLKNGVRNVIHTLFVNPKGGVVEKKFEGLFVSPGCIVRAEVKTEGNDVTVSGWLEIDFLGSENDS